MGRGEAKMSMFSLHFSSNQFPLECSNLILFCCTILLLMAIR